MWECARAAFLEVIQHVTRCREESEEDGHIKHTFLWVCNEQPHVYKDTLAKLMRHSGSRADI